MGYFSNSNWIPNLRATNNMRSLKYLFILTWQYEGSLTNKIGIGKMYDEFQDFHIMLGNFEVVMHTPS